MVSYQHSARVKLKVGIKSARAKYDPEGQLLTEEELDEESNPKDLTPEQVEEAKNPETEFVVAGFKWVPAQGSHAFLQINSDPHLSHYHDYGLLRQARNSESLAAS